MLSLLFYMATNGWKAAAASTHRVLSAAAHAARVVSTAGLAPSITVRARERGLLGRAGMSLREQRWMALEN